jgi:hypothetical protein
MLTDDHEGLLIDWDLCAELDDNNENNFGARRPPIRMVSLQLLSYKSDFLDNVKGTWQFMSAKLLNYTSISHSLYDDRESAFYVLLWTALRYIKTEAAPRSVYTPQETLEAFDELWVGPCGMTLGGHSKRLLLMGYEYEGIVFTECPELNGLMAELGPVFNARYEPELTAKQMAYLKKTLKKLEDATSEDEKQDVQEILDDSISNRYQQKMNKLGMRGWLVDTIRKYLHLGK